MKHIVVKDIKSETKVFKFIYIQDFFFLLFYMSVIYLLGNLVNVLLLVPFYIFSGLVDSEEQLECQKKKLGKPVYLLKKGYGGL